MDGDTCPMTACSNMTCAECVQAGIACQTAPTDSAHGACPARWRDTPVGTGSVQLLCVSAKTWMLGLLRTRCPTSRWTSLGPMWYNHLGHPTRHSSWLRMHKSLGLDVENRRIGR